jgi:DNA/RNA endonuclease YhcR with UshA esterase domain
MSYFSNFIFAAVIALFTASISQAETISPQDASRHVGAMVTVEGVVSQVSTSNGGTTFINFGGRFPNHVFYAVIFESQADRFPGVRGLEGKPVAISGTVELYKGKPQIILQSPDQILLID